MKHAVLSLVVLVMLGVDPGPSSQAVAAARWEDSPGAVNRKASRQVVIRLTKEAVTQYTSDLGARGRTGAAVVDSVLSECGAGEVRPLLRFRPDTPWAEKLGLSRTFVVVFGSPLDTRSAARRLSSLPGIETAEPDGTCRISASPSDPMYAQQWAHDNVGQAVAYDGSLVGSPDCDLDTDEAWDVAVGESYVTLAIIDSGVDTGHPELVGRIVSGYDFVNSDADPSDDCGHGTCCAGVAAAAGNNGVGVAGVAWGVRVMPVKVLDWDGTGAWTDFAEGIAWAAYHGARILSVSLGSPEVPPSAVEDAINFANLLGCSIFCAAGNANRHGLDWPANFVEEVAAVGALSPCNERKSPGTCDGEYWWGSNYGELLCLTPGVRIPTIDIRGAGGYDPGDYFTDFNGTSSATPYAAGVAALVLTLNPSLNSVEMRLLLARSCQDLGASGWDEQTGNGRLNGHLAVLSAYGLPTYVDWRNQGAEDGSLHHPFRTVGAGVDATGSPGQIVVFGGAYDEALGVSREVVMRAKDGVAVVGE